MIGLIKSECSKLDEFPQVKLLFEDLCEAVSRPSISLKGVVVSWKLKNLKRTAGFDDRDDASTTTPISLSTKERAAYRAVCQALMLEEDIELPEYRPTASPGAS